jgi:hypothetical protein
VAVRAAVPTRCHGQRGIWTKAHAELAQRRLHPVAFGKADIKRQMMPVDPVENDPLLTPSPLPLRPLREAERLKRIWADARSVSFHFRPIIVAAVCWLS